METNFHLFLISVTEAGDLSSRHNGTCIFGKIHGKDFDRRLGASSGGGEKICIGLPRNEFLYSNQLLVTNVFVKKKLKFSMSTP